MGAYLLKDPLKLVVGVACTAPFNLPECYVARLFGLFFFLLISYLTQAAGYGIALTLSADRPAATYHGAGGRL
jgi:hypothetical protein